ncbi:MAG: DUF697 domain-containing protein [Sedimentisphaerales bacterium]|nr:DUF697 domain-containing protein [Sedimentisphaerales bacterium]
MIFEELKRFWLLARKIALLLGIVLSFFAVLELFRAYITLRDIHWLLGYSFVVILAVLIVWTFVYFFRAFRDLPRTLTPVPREKIRKYAKYLTRYLKRLQVNPHLSPEQIENIVTHRKNLEAQLTPKTRKDDLAKTAEDIETNCIEPALKTLDNLAEKKIRAAVRDIMITVTISPYRSMDLLVVTYRNLGMIKNIAVIYNSRPSLRESLAILCDTLRVVAAVNFVNLGGKMVENLTKGLPGIIPGVSRIVDDCTEGLAAGLFSSVTGHAARHRCRAFGCWDLEQAKVTIAKQLKTFSTDVGGMFFKDILPLLRLPATVTIEKFKQLKDLLYQNFNSAVDAVLNMIKPTPYPPSDEPASPDL